MGKKGKKSKGKIDLKDNPDIRLSTGDFVLPNGDTYSGEFCAHRAGLIWRQGKGIYTSHEGQVYEGTWADDKLVDNSEVVITYPNGVIYRGRLLKNRYSGPGIYSLSNGLDLSCNFNGNKPTGEIALIDHNQNVWRGEAKDTKAVLIPENIFYLILPPERGKGLLKTDVLFPPEDKMGDQSLEKVEEEEHSENYWRNLIFARSTLTKNDMKFGDSKFWREYEKFRVRKEEIERKLKYNEKLTGSDELWLAKFREFKDLTHLKKMEKELQKKKSEEAAFDLNRKFRSPEFLNSCPEVKIIHAQVQPGTDFEYYDVTSSSGGSSLSSVPSSKIVQDQTTSSVPKRKIKPSVYLSELDNFARTLDRLPTDDSIEVKQPSRKLSTKSILHFGVDRKSKILIPRIQTRLRSEIFKDDEETKMILEIKNNISGPLITSTDSKSSSPLEAAPKSGTLNVKPGESAKISAPSSSKKLVVDEKPLTEQQKRIRGYIKERIAEWEAEDESLLKSRVRVEDKDVKKRHLHSLAFYTASIDDIPTDVFIDMFGKPLVKKPK